MTALATLLCRFGLVPACFGRRKGLAFSHVKGLEVHWAPLSKKLA